MSVRPIDVLSGNLVIGGYLPWHGTAQVDGQWSRWNDCDNLPDSGEVFSAYWPAKGPYSSADTAVLEQQACEIRQAGLDAVVIIWNNVYPGERQRVEKIMEVFGRLGLKGFVGVDIDWKFAAQSPEQCKDMVDRLDVVINEWSRPDSPFADFYYRDPVSGLPPYMIYASAGDIAFWDARVSERKAKPGTNGIFILGMTDLNMAMSRSFDGLFWTGSKKPNDRKEVEMLLDITNNDNGMFFMGGVITGFHFLKPGEVVNMDAQGGRLYHQKWSGIVEALGHYGNEVNHVYVPFNDWGEGASIEPASDTPPRRSDGRHYLTFYPLACDGYLELTRYWVKDFKLSRKK